MSVGAVDVTRVRSLLEQAQQGARSRASSSTIIFSSIITSASDTANRPISAATSGTPS